MTQPVGEGSVWRHLGDEPTKLVTLRREGGGVSLLSETGRYLERCVTTSVTGLVWRAVPQVHPSSKWTWSVDSKRVSLFEIYQFCGKSGSQWRFLGDGDLIWLIKNKTMVASSACKHHACKESQRMCTVNLIRWCDLFDCFGGKGGQLRHESDLFSASLHKLPSLLTLPVFIMDLWGFCFSASLLLTGARA